MDGDKFYCLRHYKELFLSHKMHLPQFKSDRLLTCQGCASEYIPLTPLPKPKIERSAKNFIRRVESICYGRGRIEINHNPNGVSIYFYGSFLTSDIKELEKFSKLMFTGFRWVISSV